MSVSKQWSVDASNGIAFDKQNIRKGLFTALNLIGCLIEMMMVPLLEYFRENTEILKLKNNEIHRTCF